MADEVRSQPGVEVDLGLWFGLALAGAVIALVGGQLLLALLLLTPALALGAALVWRRAGLRRVRYRRRLEPARAFPGDTVRLELTVENGKPLPLAWLEVADTFPDGLQYPGLALEPLSEQAGQRFRGRFAAWPYERIRQRCGVTCPRRGRYRFGPATLATGDPFGFARREHTIATTDDLLIYPRLLPVTRFGLPAGQPFGDAPPARPMPEDPLRFLGTRPYAPGDAPQRIHWRATARTGRVQSKTYEQAATAALEIALDLTGDVDPENTVDGERREWAISAAASAAAHALDGQRQVGVLSNAPLLGGARYVRLAASRQRGQLVRLLELLAELIPYAVQPLAPLLLDEARRLSWGATLLVVTVEPSAGLIETLLTLDRAGHGVTVLVVGDRPLELPRRPGLAVYHTEVGEDGGPAALQLA